MRADHGDHRVAVLARADLPQPAPDGGGDQTHGRFSSALSSDAGSSRRVVESVRVTLLAGSLAGVPPGETAKAISTRTALAASSATERHGERRRAHLAADVLVVAEEGQRDRGAAGGAGADAPEQRPGRAGRCRERPGWRSPAGRRVDRLASSSTPVRVTTRLSGVGLTREPIFEMNWIWLLVLPASTGAMPGATHEECSESTIPRQDRARLLVGVGPRHDAVVVLHRALDHCQDRPEDDHEDEHPHQHLGERDAALVAPDCAQPVHGHVPDAEPVPSR